MTHRVPDYNVSDGNVLVVQVLMTPRWINRHMVSGSDL